MHKHVCLHKHLFICTYILAFHILEYTTHTKNTSMIPTLHLRAVGESSTRAVTAVWATVFTAGIIDVDKKKLGLKTPIFW